MTDNGHVRNVKSKAKQKCKVEKTNKCIPTKEVGPIVFFADLSLKMPKK